jgi:hypothetical protein
MLFPSPRYGCEALTNLIDAVNAKVLLSPETPYPIETEVMEKRKSVMKRIDAPSVDALFTEKVADYPFTKTFEACKDEPLVCLREWT